MKQFYKVSWSEVLERLSPLDMSNKRIYGVPTGGMIAAGFLKHAKPVFTPETADMIIDDLIESGTTRAHYKKHYPDTPFNVLFDKQQEKQLKGKWLLLPWEIDHPAGAAKDIQNNVIRLIEFIGDDPKRPGLAKTPERVIRSYNELFAGYNEDPCDIITSFDEEEEDKYTGAVIARNVEFHSTCEHHLLPFSGVAHLAYIPSANAIIGASKLGRLLDMYARRLQNQERIAQQTVNCIMANIKPTPTGAACILEARHHCMLCRGVKQSKQDFVTPVYSGAYLEDHIARSELLTLISMGRHAY